jgi:hypothetical protein
MRTELNKTIIENSKQEHKRSMSNYNQSTPWQFVTLTDDDSYRELQNRYAQSVRRFAMSSRRDQHFNKLQRNVVAAEEAIASQQIEDFLLGAEVDFY